MAERDKAGRFQPGNRIWEARTRAGLKPIFEDGDALWEACVGYFQWVEDNPLYEAKAFSYEGKVKIADLPKMRAMTVGGLCVYLQISETTWHAWRNSRADLSEVIEQVERIIRAQKFEGASAGLLQPQIIARDLGLVDRKEHTGKDGGPIETRNLSDDDLAAKIAELKMREALGE